MPAAKRFGFVRSFVRRVQLRESASRRATAQIRRAVEPLEVRTLLAGTWTQLTNMSPDALGAQSLQLLTDGSVMVQGGSDSASNAWYRLTPDSTGSYVDGTWSTLAPMNLEREFFTSHVLQDGRVLVMGGKFTGPTSVFTEDGSGEIFDPSTDSWTSIADLGILGNAPTGILPDGRILVSYNYGTQTFIYNPLADSYSAAPSRRNSDPSFEGSWVKLPDDSILTFNTGYNLTSPPNNAQRFDPVRNTWVASGTVPVALRSNPGSGNEMGAAMLLHDGRVLQIGGNSNTALYSPSSTRTGSGTWAAGPVIPGGLGGNHAAATLLVNGDVLFAAGSTPTQSSPTSLFEFNPTGNTITPVTTPAALTTALSTANSTADQTRMLPLPSGQVLLTTGDQQLWVYTPTGSPNTSWLPTISGITTTGGGTFTLTGTQLNGLTQGASYAGNSELSANHPIVRLTDSLGAVFYAQSSNWSSTGVATGAASVTVDFSLPAGLGVGTYQVQAIANGLQSTAATLTISAAAITSGNSTTIREGAAGTFTITTTGNPIPSLNVAGTLPSGVTFVDNGDGTATLSGTPAAGTAGTYTLTISAQNGAGAAATQAFSLNVTAPPTFTSQTNAQFTVGTTSTFAISTNGFPTAAITRTGALPAGLTFLDNGNGTATISGSAAAASGGVYTITLSAQNGTLPNASQSLTINVSEAPVFTSVNNRTFIEGVSSSFTISTRGFPSVALSEQGSLPAGLIFTDNGNGTATISGAASSGTVGTYTLILSAQNGVSPDATQFFTITVNQAPKFTSAGTAKFIVGTAGTFTVTTTGVPAVTQISASGALPAGVTFTDNGDGTATIAGTPAAGTANNYTITLTAQNGSTGSQAFTLAVSQPPIITSTSSAAFRQGAASTFTVTSTSVPPASLTVTGTLPTGVTFVDNGDGTGTLAGTPAVGTTGSYPLTITATNPDTPSVTQSFTLSVTLPPQITSGSSQTIQVGNFSSILITTSSTGFPVAALSQTGALPGGLSFLDNGDGTATISGVAASGTAGTYVLNISAQNGVAPNATQTFTLTVTEIPIINSPATTTFTVGSLGTFTITTAGLPAISKSAGLPPEITLVDNGDGTATLSGTPATGSGGRYTTTITAKNSSGTDTQSFVLLINEAPAITSAATAEFNAASAWSFNVSTLGFPAPALSTNGTLPTGVTFVDHRDGTATLSSGSGGLGGVYNFTIIAQNGAPPNATQAFTLIIDQAPTITSPTLTSFVEGTAGTFTVRTTGSPSATITPVGALPGGVSFTDNGDGTGSFSGTPSAGTAGVYTVTIGADNGIDPAASQTFTLNVNRIPSITSPATVTFSETIAQTFPITTGGFPFPTLKGTGTLPAGVVFKVNTNGTGSLEGTPLPGSLGTYTFTITASNGTLPNAVQTLRITVNQPAKITSAASAIFAVGVSGTFAVTTTGSPTPAITLAGSLPAGLVFRDNGNGTATLSGTPTGANVGNFPVTFTARNGGGPNATQAFTIDVGVRPAITSAGSTAFSLGKAGTFTFVATGVTTPAIAISGALPSGVTFVDHGNGTATLSGTPAAGTAGAYSLTVTASNQLASVATQTFQLSVTQAPVLSDPTTGVFTIGVPGSYGLTATGFPVPTWTVVGALPSGVTFNSLTGILSGTPAVNAQGNYPLSLRASNGIGGVVSQAVTLFVQPSTTVSAPNVTTNQTTPYTFSVTYFDNTAVDVSTLGAGNVRVTGPNSFSQVATFVSVDRATDGTPRTGTYRINPPTGGWTSANNGSYTISAGSTPARNTANHAFAGAFGTFGVQVPLTLAAGVHNLRLSFQGGQVVVVDTDRANQTVTSQSSATPLTLNAVAGGDNTLTIDPAGFTGSSTITFNGAAGVQNAISVLTGPFTSATIIYTGADDGILQLVNGSNLLTINFTSQTSLTSLPSVADMNPILPDGSDAVLQAGIGNTSELFSNNNAFVPTTFTNPTSNFLLTLRSTSGLNLVQIPSTAATARIPIGQSDNHILSRPSPTTAEIFSARAGTANQILFVDMTRVTGAQLTNQGLSGNWTFSNRAALSYSNIASVVPVERLFRAYNSSTGFHFYTNSAAEFDAVVSAGLHDESTGQEGFAVSQTAALNAVKMLRLYNPNGGQHYYTLQTGEASVLTSLGWKAEGNTGYLFSSPVAGTSEIFHLYNRNNGEHLFTQSVSYRDALQQQSRGVWVVQNSLGFGVTVPAEDAVPDAAPTQSPITSSDIAANARLAAPADETTSDMTLAIVPDADTGTTPILDDTETDSNLPSTTTSSDESDASGLDEFWTAAASGLQSTDLESLL